jgi:hypothetical protein
LGTLREVNDGLSGLKRARSELRKEAPDIEEKIESWALTYINTSSNTESRVNLKVSVHGSRITSEQRE